MIFDRIENLENYTAIHERLAKGLRLLKETDFASMEPGRYEVDGTELYYMVQCYDSKEANDRPEAHRKYADIQYVVSGEEKIGVAPLQSMEEEISSVPEKDNWFYRGAVSDVKMDAGCFMVLFPQDAHAPGKAIAAPSPVRKVVVKVLL